MKGYLPDGYRLLVDVRDEIGAEPLLSELSGGVKEAFRWDKKIGRMIRVAEQEWLRTGAEQLIATGFFNQYPTYGRGQIERQVLLIKKPLEWGSPEPEPVKSKGGAPTKHDWAGAAAVAVAYIVENDYPTKKTELSKHLLRWFEAEAGRQPDDREVARFVGAIYSERDRVKP